MTYSINHVGRTARTDRIQLAITTSTTTDDFYDFRGTKYELPVIRLGIDVPIYRMENFRTFTEQASLVARDGRAPDFFKSGQENESVQQKQHAILVDLAKQGQFPSIEVIRREGSGWTIAPDIDLAIARRDPRVSTVGEHR